MDFPFTDAEQVRRIVLPSMLALPRDVGVVAARAPSISQGRPVYSTCLSRLTLTPTPLKQRFVLAEAIKTSSIPVEKLINFIDDGNVQPAWTQMLLPLGKPYLSSSQLPQHKLQAPVKYI